MIVLDASVALAVILRGPEARTAEARIFDSGESLNAPHLIDVEVMQVLRRFALAGIASASRCETARADFALFPLVRHPHHRLLARVWQFRSNLTAYDATYVALAEALGATLLTADRRLANAPGVRAPVELLA